MGIGRKSKSIEGQSQERVAAKARQEVIEREVMDFW